jgi:hypothetical protein
MTLPEMATVIARKEGCDCRYVNTISVVERFKGETAWEGNVHVFALDRGSPPNEICYAWVDPDAQTLVTVLKRPPVHSPETAVRAYIASR